MTDPIKIKFIIEMTKESDNTYKEFMLGIGQHEGNINYDVNVLDFVVAKRFLTRMINEHFPEDLIQQCEDSISRNGMLEMIKPDSDTKH